MNPEDKLGIALPAHHSGNLILHRYASLEDLSALSNGGAPHMAPIGTIKCKLRKTRRKHMLCTFQYLS